MIIWGGMDTAYPPHYWNDGMLYDPSTDTWTLMSPSGQGGRSYASTVWTGTHMIIWGGSVSGGLDLNTGLTYDPAADTWGTTSTTGAPTAREQHFGWWTGSVMVIWGGSGSGGLMFSGGRYSPGSDTWQPVSTVNATIPRYNSTSVWTGTEMIVWGGISAGIVGGRYNPATDSWVPTNSYNIPSPRRAYAEVWTGTEVVLWGGDDSTNTPVPGPGGRYNPATDAWAPLSVLNAPVPSTKVQGVWTGTTMIVWGGMTDPSGTPTNTGGVYDVVADTWSPTSLVNAPTARLSSSLIWTGTRMVAWGGTDATGTIVNTGGQYDPATSLWTSTSTVNAVGRTSHSSVWTGTEMIVWGGYAPSASNTGQRYNPSTDLWTDVTTTGAPDARALHSAVWTGTKMIIWGGSAPVQLGASYDPVMDTWASISSTGAPSGRYGNAAVWTGHEMVIWGGIDTSGGSLLNSGGRYRPSADAWSATSTAGAPTPRQEMPGVFTGNALAVWSGVTDGDPSSFGGLYWMSPNPGVTGVNPTTGPAAGGASVTITGSLLAGTTSVSFGGTPAASFVVNSNSSITAVSPAHAVGTVDIVVSTADGTSATSPTDQYTFASMPTLVLQSQSFADACSAGGLGSGDGYVDPGEDIALNVVLSNTGTAAATGVHADLATTTPGVAITAGTASFPDIAAGGTGSSATPLQFTVARTHACGDTLAFTLQITANEGSWQATFTLPVGHYGPPPTITLFSENFDGTGGALPTGWATETVQGTTWYVGNASSFYCSSPYALQYNCSTTVTADAWAYTPAQALTAGVTYILSFSDKVAARKSHAVSVWLGGAQNHAAMATEIWSATLSGTTCATQTMTFTVPSSGTYYLGIHETSGISQLLFAVDDVNLSYLGVGSCIINSCAPNPKEASAAGTPMKATASVGTAVGITFTPACSATDHAVYWGQGPVTNTLVWTSSACGLGTSGSASFDPGTLPPGGWIYFVVVGQNAVSEGSYGLDSQGGERPAAVAVGGCNHPQNLTGTCP